MKKCEEVASPKIKLPWKFKLVITRSRLIEIISPERFPQRD